MALKYKFKDVKEIPAGDERHYVERGGEWVLDADGVVEKSKLDEFRNTNLALIKERDELKQRFDGIDPDEVRKLAEEKRKLELQAQGHKPEELDRLVGERVKGLNEHPQNERDENNSVFLANGCFVDGFVARAHGSNKK